MICRRGLLFGTETDGFAGGMGGRTYGTGREWMCVRVGWLDRSAEWDGTDGLVGQTCGLGRKRAGLRVDVQVRAANRDGTGGARGAHAALASHVPPICGAPAAKVFARSRIGIIRHTGA